jgi:glycine/D-amino acid oxidase-like deaminating enzyme
MRTEPVVGGPEISASGDLFAFRKRMDGGYTVATLGMRTIDLVPDNFRLLPQFLPAVRLHWKKLRFRVGRRWIEEWRMPRRWSLDRPSPFERVRVLDPEPDLPVLNRAREALAEVYPLFRDVAIAERWAGMIDVTPDAVPVISPVDAVPGLVIATGFSGHGFGIGPAAGLLAADLATGGPPIVDPAPFRLSRFTDGSRPLPSPIAS